MMIARPTENLIQNVLCPQKDIRMQSCGFELKILTVYLTRSVDQILTRDCIDMACHVSQNNNNHNNISNSYCSDIIAMTTCMEKWRHDIPKIT